MTDRANFSPRTDRPKVVITDYDFGDVAVELIDNVFDTPITFRQHTTATFDPLTGATSITDTPHVVNAGVLARNRVEDGGTGETYDISIWVHHGSAGLPFLPTTEDSFTYDSILWRVIEVSPTYSSKGLIASKIKGRSA